MQILRRRSHPREGAALVEAALVLPLFLMIVFGIVEFGRAFMFCQMLQNSAREACRKSVTGAYTTAQVTSDMKTELATLGVQNTADLTITVAVTVATGNPAVANNEVANATTGDLVTVTVKILFSKVAVIPANYLGTASLTGRSAMRHE